MRHKTSLAATSEGRKANRLLREARDLRCGLTLADAALRMSGCWERAADILPGAIFQSWSNLGDAHVCLHGSPE